MCCGDAQKKRNGQEALGRSRGGFSTKIHAVTDALGYPVAFLVTGGQEADINQALALLPDKPFQALLADKGYDADCLINELKSRNVEAVIPPKSNRIEQRACDWWLYKERHLIECFFGKIKQYRRIFSRFEKSAENYLAFLSFVSALCWLR